MSSSSSDSSLDSEEATDFRPNQCCDAGSSPKQFNTTTCYKSSDQKKIDWAKIVHPARVVTYEDMLRLINDPGVYIIDVRKPKELQETGRIPTSINIPLSCVPNMLECVSGKEFQCSFGREKPSKCDPLIFYCRSGYRASKALFIALNLGYCNSKTYTGSWKEWSARKRCSCK